MREAGRNEPCPCGSGRKYKACCLAADQAAMRAGVAPSASERMRTRVAVREAARAAQSWEVDMVPVNMWVGGRDPDSSLAMVGAGGFVVHGDVIPRRPAGTVQRVEALAEVISAAGRVAGVLPERVVVRDPVEAGALGRALADRGITVQAGPLAELDDALDGALAHLAGSRARALTTLSGAWAETGCTAEELARFHVAAAEFYRAEPWRLLPNVDPLLIRFPEGTEWGAAVMGGGGIEFGLALYSNPSDLLRLMEPSGPDPEADEIVDALLGFTLTVDFEAKGELTRAMQREVGRAGWPVAGPRAYPRLFGVRVPERRITAGHVTAATLALRAVTLLVHRVDPEPETGVVVMPLGGMEDDTIPWPLPDHAGPVLAEGPGAEPEAAIGRWMLEEGKMREAGRARLARLQAWLEGQELPKTARKAAAHNGQCWESFLEEERLSAGAVTEYDLRVFLYAFYPLSADATPAAAADLVRSLGLIFRFLEAEEGVRYPFAAGVLEELGHFAAIAKSAGAPFDAVLEQLAPHLWENLDGRRLLYESELPGTVRGTWGGPTHFVEIAHLRDELQRRWLLWMDEEVRTGSVDFETLGQALLARQRAWENTPHGRTGGGTPWVVVNETGEAPPGEQGDLA
jgi:hypothetical protein